MIALFFILLVFGLATAGTNETLPAEDEALNT